MLQDIDLELEPGKTVALIGHTGSGKTTLAALVPRFYDVGAGPAHDRRRRRPRRRRSSRCAARSASSRRIRSSSRRPCARTSRFGRPDATDEEVERAARARAGARVHRAAPGRLRHGDRRARDHALRRPAPAARDRARARSSTRAILILDDATASVDATTEARIRLGLREAMKGRTTIIIAHRLSTISLADELVVLDDGRDRRRAARTRSCSRRARSTATSTSTACSSASSPSGSRRGRRMRVWQPGSHLTQQRGAKVDDWSWRADRCAACRRSRGWRRRTSAQTALALGSLLAATATALAAALPGEARDRRRHPQAGPARAHDRRRRSSSSPASLNLGHERGADVLHGLDGRAHPRRPAQHALPPPAAALARLLRAQPRRRDHQPPDERRRGARPARDRRRDDARPEHADPDRHVDHPLLPRLAARARDDDGPPVHVRRDGVLPHPLGARLPGGARAARPRHRDARRGHRRHARRPGVPPRARERAQLPRGQRALPRRRTSRRSCSTASTSRSSTSSRRSRRRSCSATAATSSSAATSRSARCSRSSSTCRTSSTRCSSSRSSTTRSSSAVAALDKIMDVMDEEPEVRDEADARELDRDRRATSASRTCASATATGRRCCTASTSTSRPGRPSRSSATPARASRRSPSCSRASTTRVEGRITIDGVDLRDVTQASLRRQLGVVPQEGFLFAGTVRDNIAFGRPDATRPRCAAAAQAVGAHEFIMRLEDGYETNLQERGTRLSLGQRQLVALRARAARRPAHPHPRRGDLVGRHRHRAADRERRCGRCSPTGPRSSSRTGSRRSATPT